MEERIDPLRILNLPEVIRRTGYCRRKIMSLVSEDQHRGTPGVNFAAPMQRPKLGKLEWREITLVRWLEQQEKISA